MLSWSHCIPTVDRFEVLKTAVACSLAQTVKPRDILIADASPYWKERGEELKAMAACAGVALRSVPARAKSSAVQRNQAGEMASGDILIFTDDDSFMFPDYAERTLAAYANPAIVGVGGVEIDDLPPTAQESVGGLERKEIGGPAGEPSGLARWVSRNVLMMTAEAMFVPYEERQAPAITIDPAEGWVSHVQRGFAMSTRREIFEKEPFNPHLLAYSPLEDLDASFRYGRHGETVILRTAKMHHFAAAASRVGRLAATSLGISNMALFIRMSGQPAQSRFWSYVARRLFAEIIKDGGSRRWEFPQARGVLSAIPVSRRMFSEDAASLPDWYRLAQQRTLGGGAPAKP